jgi:very-short-patch-repair endonuclease
VRAIIARARRLRSNLTDAEKYLWRHLRLRQIAGHKFRRQRPMGPYIVDFVCIEKKVVVEVDGGQHNGVVSRDYQRDEWFRAQGYTVLRFWNHEVLTQTDHVKEMIWSALDEPPPFSSPACGGGKNMRTVRR